MEEGILQGICMEMQIMHLHFRPHPWKVEQVCPVRRMVFLPDLACRQEELDLKPMKCKCSPAGEWLLESRLLTGNDWERAWHSGSGRMCIRISMSSFSQQVIFVLECGGDCWRGPSVGTWRSSSFH